MGTGGSSTIFALFGVVHKLLKKHYYILLGISVAHPHVVMDSISARETATGLEDDDNFYELVRQFSGLDTREQAAKLTAQVISEVAMRVPKDVRAMLLPELPLDLRDQISEKVLGFRNLTLVELEHKVQKAWGVEIERAAKFVAAVGIALSDRLDVDTLAHLRHVLPDELIVLFPVRA